MAHPGPRRRRTGALVLAGVLLLISVLGTLIVPIYARSTPKLGAFPFFYWYQLIWVVVVAVLSWIAYLLTRSRGSATAPPSEPARGAGETQ